MGADAESTPRFSPHVELLHASATPNAELASPIGAQVAAARTCYSPRGVIKHDVVMGRGEEDPEKQKTRRDNRLKIAASTSAASHNTTLQHMYFTFGITGVSRQLLWQVLHNHPFYTSEQQSQRYVEQSDGAFVRVPFRSAESAAIYERAVDELYGAYRDLSALLKPIAASELIKRFDRYTRNPQRWEKELELNAKKKAQEVARYVLPVSAAASLHHTVNTNVLLRYHAAQEMLGAPQEEREIVRQMVQIARSLDSDIDTLLPRIVDLESTAEYAAVLAHQQALGVANGDVESYVRDPTVMAARKRALYEFDEALEGRISCLVTESRGNEHVLASSVRGVLGISAAHLNDEDAIRLAMDPARNPHIYTPTTTSTLSPIARATMVVHYTFRKRLSHTADSQDQRHRMTPGARPVLLLDVAADPDYAVPALLSLAGDDAMRVYERAMMVSWEARQALLARAEPAELVQYLDVNARNIRFYQGSDLLNLQWKHAMRQCLNAQEEIWRASAEEAQQIRAVNPTIGSLLLPPCALRQRAGVKPPCPEGTRYCGVPVFRQDQDFFLAEQLRTRTI